MSTTYERTVNVPFESRLIFVSRQTTTNDRTVDIPKEDRYVYVAPKTPKPRKAGFQCIDNEILIDCRVD